MINRSFAVMSLFCCCFAQAEVVNIPNASGFSGFLTGGLGSTDYKSNMFTGINDKNIRHGGLHNTPNSHSGMNAIYSLDLRYTFSDTRTQLYFGNLIQDTVRFDFTQQAGIRQQITDYGIISVAYVFPLAPAKTWSDPYENGKRDETKMYSNGFRVSWDHIMDSPFSTAYTVRKFNVKDEHSGESLKLGAKERNLLSRNGNSYEMALFYDWSVSQGHLVQPEITYLRSDLDGGAMSYNKTSLLLSYGYASPQWSIASSLYGSTLNYDEVNPIYETKANSIEFGINSTFFWHHLAGVEGLNAFISASYSKYDSDIRFYDSYIKSLNLGFVYKF